MGLERLEERQLLAANVLGSAEGTILSTPGQTPDSGDGAIVELTVDPSTPRVLIGLIVGATDGDSGLDPSAPRVSLDGVPVSTRYSAADVSATRSEGITLVELIGGETYSLSVSDEADASGPFRIDVVLPGDVTGDGAVDGFEFAHASAAVVQTQFGLNHVSRLFFRQQGLSDISYDEALDANADGRIDSSDLAWIQRNVGVTSVTVELGRDEEPPVIEASLTPDTGSLDDDGLTNDADATIAGTLSDNSAIASFTAAIDSEDELDFVDLFGTSFFAGHDFAADPSFSLTLSQLEEIDGAAVGSLLNSGPHTLYLMASDEFGGSTTTPLEIDFEFDTTAPDVPTQLAVADGETGVVADSTPTLTVSVTGDALVQLFSDLVDGAIGEASGNGTVTITADVLLDGVHQITATATDAAGNVSAASDALQIVIDTGVPGLTDFGLLPATIETDNDGNPLTQESAVTIAGTTEAGAVVELLEGDLSLGTTTSESDGTFSFADIELSFGQTQFAVIVTDAASNESTFQRSITRGTTPEVVSPLGQRTLGDAQPGFTVELSAVFLDADVEDQGALALTAVSDDTSLIEVAVDGTVLTVTPQVGELGTAEITVRATDSIGLFVEDVLTVTIQQNDPPVVTAPAEITVLQDTEIAIPGITVSDVDLDESGLFLSLRAGGRDDSADALTGLMSVTIVGDVLISFGTATDSDRITLLGGLDDINATLATLTYRPNPGFTGSTVLTVIANDFGVAGPDDAGEGESVIDITVEANQPPIANEDSFSIGEDDSLTENVLVDNGNGADVDPEDIATELTITNIGNLTTALGAKVTLSANGDFTYDPSDSDTIQAFVVGDTRTDLFEYIVSDGDATSVGTVVITISGANDAPVARDDQFGTEPSISIGGNVLNDNGHGDDVDVDGGSVLEVTTVGEITSELGALVTVASNGDFTYDPSASAALQALSGDQQLTDSFDYTISDGTDIATATVFVTVTAEPNAEPVARGEAIQVDGDSTDNPIDVLANDETEAGETLTILDVGDPTEGGTVSFAPGGTEILYTPADRFLGTDRFTYTVDDGRGGTATALVTVQVTPGQAALDAEIHATLSIFVDGEKLASPPAEVGVSAGTITSPIHSIDGNGRLRIGPIGDDARTEPSTLGDFFDTWRTGAGDVGNNPDAIFNQSQILDNTLDEDHGLVMYVNGVPNSQFENYIPEDEDIIVISYEAASSENSPTLVPIEDITIEAGAPLHISLDGFDFEGDSLTYTVTSDNPELVSTFVPEGNRTMRIQVADYGVMTFELFDGRAPRVTNTIAALAEDGVYDGVIFHRIIENFVIQGGDPTGTGFGDPSIPDFDDQFHVDLQHTSEGVLSMAKSDDDTNSSQFFITAAPTRGLDFNHSVFARLIEGENVRRVIARVPVDGSTPIDDVVMDNVQVLLDQENAVLMLSAPEGAAGQTEVTVTVDDGLGGTYTRSFSVTVQSDDVQNGGPFLEDISEIRTTADTPVEIRLTAVDVEGDAAQFEAGVLGDTDFELVVDMETGNDLTAVVTVTPPSEFVGTLEIIVGTRPVDPSDTGQGRDFDTQIFSIIVEAPAAALMASSELDAGMTVSSPETLTESDPRLQRLLTEAVDTWQDALGKTEAIDVHLEVQNYCDARLAEAYIEAYGNDGLPASGVITIDADGAGAGWHLDLETQPDADVYDLYTVLLHEVGHVLGLSDGYAALADLIQIETGSGPVIRGPGFEAWLDVSGDHLDVSAHPDDLMNASLPTGQRRLPSELDTLILAALHDGQNNTAATAADSRPNMVASEHATSASSIDEVLSNWP